MNTGIPKIQFLGLSLNPISVEELHRFIESVIQSRQKALILHLNIQGANLAIENTWLKEFYQKAPLVFCDGDGIRLGLKILGYEPPAKITYAAWIWQLAAFCEEKGRSLYLLGSKPGVAEKAAERLTGKFPRLQIAGTHHGYFEKEGSENEKVLSEINRAKPDILLVGLGMPLQEKWLSEYWQKIESRVCLTAGAALDYTSGNLKRAPAWMVRLHIEWLFRLFQEPQRLFVRYVIGNPKFLFRVLKEKWIQK